MNPRWRDLKAGDLVYRLEASEKFDNKQPFEPYAYCILTSVEEILETSSDKVIVSFLRIEKGRIFYEEIPTSRDELRPDDMLDRELKVYQP